MAMMMEEEFSLRPREEEEARKARQRREWKWHRDNILCKLRVPLAPPTLGRPLLAIGMCIMCHGSLGTLAAVASRAFLSAAADIIMALMGSAVFGALDTGR